MTEIISRPATCSKRDFVFPLLSLHRVWWTLSAKDNLLPPFKARPNKIAIKVELHCRSNQVPTHDANPSHGEDSSRPTRNESRGLRTTRDVESNRKIKIIISNDKKQQVGKHIKDFVSKLGVIAQDYAPQCYESWLKIPKPFRHNQLFPKVEEWFDVDLKQPNVLKYMDYYMGRAYSNYRTKNLKTMYLKYSPVDARRHWPKKVSEADWKYLCLI